MMQNGKLCSSRHQARWRVEVKDTYRSVTKKYPFLGIPFIRGVFKFADSMIVGMRALAWSCSFFEDDEDAKKAALNSGWIRSSAKLKHPYDVIMIFSFIMAIRYQLCHAVI